jgi:hypothetical protein
MNLICPASGIPRACTIWPQARRNTIARLILASPTLEVHSRGRRRPASGIDELSRRSVGLREIGFDGLPCLRLCD